MRLRFYTFGHFTAYRGDDILAKSEWRSRHAHIVCKVLLTQLNSSLSVARLCAWVWPSGSSQVQNAETALYHALKDLEQVLGGHGGSSNGSVDGLIETIREQMSHAWVDAQVLTATAKLDPDTPEAIEQFQVALRLYRGLYLHDVGDADWVTIRRQECAQAYQLIQLKLIDAYAMRGSYRRAVQLCRRILVSNPTFEAAFDRLLVYAYYAGETGLGLHAYDLYAAALSERQGLHPHPRLTEMANRLRQGAPPLADYG